MIPKNIYVEATWLVKKRVFFLIDLEKNLNQSIICHALPYRSLEIRLSLLDVYVSYPFLAGAAITVLCH